MKMLTIVPAEKPASFEAVKFTQQEWAAANKAGPVKVPAVTAMEAIRNGKGLYKIKEEGKETVQVELKGLKEPEQMTPSELVAEMTSHGKPPRKKMTRPAAISFVKELRAKAEAFIVDEADDDTNE